MTEKTDRLFVPLTAQAFGWWQSGRRKWEVRKRAKRWGPPHVYTGRRVELRRGYSGPSLWGRIRQVRSTSLRFLPALVRLDHILPPESSFDALRVAIRAVDLECPVVAFEVYLDDPIEDVWVER